MNIPVVWRSTVEAQTQTIALAHNAELARYKTVCETQRAVQDAHVVRLEESLAYERRRNEQLSVDLRQLGERLANREREVTRETPSAVTLPHMLADTVEQISGGNATWRRLNTRKAWALWEEASQSTDPGTLAAVASALRYGESLEREK